jgi:hypothetical protein
LDGGVGVEGAAVGEVDVCEEEGFAGEDEEEAEGEGGVGARLTHHS